MIEQNLRHHGLCNSTAGRILACAERRGRSHLSPAHARLFRYATGIELTHVASAARAYIRQKRRT